jgi:regulator of protease activity HflC (stomatin/prohibitin superfamily)
MKKYLIGLLLLATVSMTMTSCFKHVPPRNVGIKVKVLGDNKGVQPITLGVGRWWIGAYWDLYTYPTNITLYPFTANPNEGSKDDESMRFQDKDGLQLSCDVAVSAQVDPNLVTTTFQTYGGDMENIIRTYVRQDLQNAFIAFSSKLSAEQLYSTEKMNMLSYVTKSLSEKYAKTGVIVTDVAYKSDIRLPKEVMDAITSKIEAGQQAMKTQTQILQSEAEAKKVAAKAEGEYQAKLLEAKGNIALANSITPALTSYLLAQKWNGVSPIYSGSGSVLPPIFGGLK